MTVTDIKLKAPKYKTIGTAVSNCTISRNLTNRNFLATAEFFKGIRRGQIDITLINRFLNGFNCLLINTNFANYMYSNAIGIAQALEEFTSVNTDTFSKSMSKNNVNDVKQFMSLGFVGCIEYLSKELERCIILITPSSSINTYHEIVYVSKNKTNYGLVHKMPIYLLLNNEHVSFVYNFKLQRNSKFCYICVENVSNSGFHRCKLKMCRLCHRYLNNIDIHTQNTCNSKSLSDAQIVCNVCNNFFVNQNC